MTDLAVIVVSYNVRDLLAQTLRSLQTSLLESELRTRILVVENVSKDESAAMVRADFPDVELLEPGENLGFAGGNNYALRHLGFEKGKHGDAEWVWLLNPDTEVVGDAPQQLVAYGRSQPRVGALGPKLQYGDGSFQHGAFGFPGLAQIAFDLFPVPGRLLESRLNGRYPAARWQGDKPFAVEMLLGAALMVRGDTIADIGLLDEGYFMYVEELDWCRQMDAAGWWLRAVPSATVIHHSGQSTQQFRDQMFVALWRSRLRYYQKWESPRYVALVRALLRFGLRWQSRLATQRPDSELSRRLQAYREVSAL